MFKARLLVVDDEQSIIELLARKLGRLSYKVYSAGSGRESLEILRRTAVDVLITDLKMPEMNGLELIERAIQIDPTLHGIIVSGCADIKTVNNAIKEAIIGYFEKPIDFIGLNKTIEESLELRKLLENAQS